MKTDGKRKKWPLRFWIYLVPLAVIGLFVGICFTLSSSVNRLRIPAEMEQMPPELAARTASLRSPAQTTTSTLFALPIARRTSAGTVLKEPTQFKPAHTGTYEEFLEAELRERPNLDGARMYLALSQHFQSNKESRILDEFDQKPGGTGNLWMPGETLPPQDVQWLKNHTGLVDQFLRFAESGGLPARTRDLLARDSEISSLPVPNFLLLQRCGRVLAAEGQRRMEAGDLAGAWRVWHSAIRLAANVGAEPLIISKLIGIRALDDTIQPLKSWVASGNAPRETMSAIDSLLVQVQVALFPQNWVTDEMDLNYPWVRKMTIFQMNGTWKSPMFGWDVERNFDKYSFSVGRVELPRYDLMAVTALRAMHNKRFAPQWLREMDQYQLELTRRLRMTWPEQTKAGLQPAISPDNPYANSASPNYWSVKARGLRAQTEMNLLRAAVGYHLAAPDSKPQPGRFTPGDRESCWRDPFSEAPLKTAGPTSATLRLYSVGPDLQDQAGAIKYDPTNGTLSAGDLILDLKR